MVGVGAVVASFNVGVAEWRLPPHPEATEPTRMPMKTMETTDRTA
jgi:hypothetical protein